MREQCACAQIERPVYAIQQPGIGIEFFGRDRNPGLGFRQCNHRPYARFGFGLKGVLNESLPGQPVGGLICFGVHGQHRLLGQALDLPGMVAHPSGSAPDEPSVRCVAKTQILAVARDEPLCVAEVGVVDRFVRANGFSEILQGQPFADFGDNVIANYFGESWCSRCGIALCNTLRCADNVAEA